MKTNKNQFLKKLTLMGMSAFLFLGAFGQVKFTSKSVAVTVSGTSTLHDWDMKSAQGNFEGTFTQNAAGAITAVSGVSFSINGNSLKSGHDAMDKNAYKALKTDKANAISFVAGTATVSALDATDFVVKAPGKLTIAGTTLNAEVTATCKVNADKSITIMGSQKISMKDYKMDPPTFMMGTIKTGNDVTLKFDLKISK